MTGAELKHLRGDRTRDELARILGTSASTLNNWERDISPVPAWVTEKMFKNASLVLPLEDLESLLDIARRESLAFDKLLTVAIRNYIKTRKIAQFPQDQSAPKAAEDASEYGKGTK